MVSLFFVLNTIFLRKPRIHLKSIVMPLASMHEIAFGLMKTSFHSSCRFLCTIASDSTMLLEKNLGALHRKTLTKDKS
jgi:hypothetical protein